MEDSIDHFQIMEIEQYYPYLSTEEMLTIQERLAELRNTVSSIMPTTTGTKSTVSRRRSTLADRSLTFLKSFKSDASVRLENGGKPNTAICWRNVLPFWEL